mmetsp:Transcript_14878/g.59656  ORF Transcript_14878/g.59656 Transcript_14878/m.59656 type:complete len:404 (+) Transcript_14878:1166-2377(+)
MHRRVRQPALRPQEGAAPHLVVRLAVPAPPPGPDARPGEPLSAVVRVRRGPDRARRPRVGALRQSRRRLGGGGQEAARRARQGLETRHQGARPQVQARAPKTTTATARRGQRRRRCPWWWRSILFGPQRCQGRRRVRRHRGRRRCCVQCRCSRECRAVGRPRERPRSRRGVLRARVAHVAAARRRRVAPPHDAGAAHRRRPRQSRGARHARRVGRGAARAFGAEARRVGGREALPRRVRHRRRLRQTPRRRRGGETRPRAALDRAASADCLFCRRDVVLLREVVGGLIRCFWAGGCFGAGRLCCLRGLLLLRQRRPRGHHHLRRLGRRRLFFFEARQPQQQRGLGLSAFALGWSLHLSRRLLGGGLVGFSPLRLSGRLSGAVAAVVVVVVSTYRSDVLRSHRI